MRNVIELKKAVNIEAGHYILKASYGQGIITAHRVTMISNIDENWLQITCEGGLISLVRRDHIISVVF